MVLLTLDNILFTETSINAAYPSSVRTRANKPGGTRYSMANVFWDLFKDYTTTYIVVSAYITTSL